MIKLAFGVVYRTPEYLRQHARIDDHVDVVLLRSTFVDPPRAAGARSLAQTIERHHPQAMRVPYAWSCITHNDHDQPSRGTRTVPGETRNLGHLQSSDEVEHAWQVTQTAMEGLGAKQLILRTPPTFGPGSLQRRRLAAFQKKVAEQGFHIVWEPEGLWTPDVARPVARQLGLDLMIPATSVTGQVSPDLGPDWLRVEGELPGRVAENLAYELLGTLQDQVDGDRTTTLVFDGPRAYANLRNFRRAWQMYADELDALDE